MEKRTVISICAITLIVLASRCEGFPKKKLLIGLGVKAHVGNVLLQNAARLAQFKQQLAENVLGTAVKHARTKADILQVLLSATQALHNLPHAQYGDHTEDVTTPIETVEDITSSPDLPETYFPAPEHTAGAAYAPPEQATPQVAYTPPESSHVASSGIYPPSPYAPALPPAPAPAYGPAPPIQSYGFPNNLQGSASNYVTVNNVRPQH